MGEVRVEIEVVNAGDVVAGEEGHIPADKVRRALVKVVADTGAVMTMLPQDLVEALGVRVRRTAVVTYADERKEERPVAGPITVNVAKRSAIVECIVGPPTSEALLGQIPLAAMDLLVDCNQQRLTPRPESPYLPTLKLK